MKYLQEALSQGHLKLSWLKEEQAIQLVEAYSKYRALVEAHPSPDWKGSDERWFSYVDKFKKEKLDLWSQFLKLGDSMNPEVIREKEEKKRREESMVGKPNNDWDGDQGFYLHDD